MRDNTDVICQLWFAAGVLAPTPGKQAVCLGTGFVIFLINMGFDWLVDDMRRK